MADKQENVASQISDLFRSSLVKSQIDETTVDRLIHLLNGGRLPKTEELLQSYEDAVSGEKQ